MDYFYRYLQLCTMEGSSVSLICPFVWPMGNPIYIDQWENKIESYKPNLNWW